MFFNAIDPQFKLIYAGIFLRQPKHLKTGINKYNTTFYTIHFILFFIFSIFEIYFYRYLSIYLLHIYMSCQTCQEAPY